jgi:hypothetical protein
MRVAAMAGGIEEGGDQRKGWPGWLGWLVWCVFNFAMGKEW